MYSCRQSLKSALFFICVEPLFLSLAVAEQHKFGALTQTKLEKQTRQSVSCRKIAKASVLS